MAAARVTGGIALTAGALLAGTVHLAASGGQPFSRDAAGGNGDRQTISGLTSPSGTPRLPNTSVDVQRLGADQAGTVNSSAAILAACSSAAATGRPLAIVGKLRIARPVTLDCNVSFSRSSMLLPDKGVVVTIEGHVIASPLQQIFASPAPPVTITGNVNRGLDRIAVVGRVPVILPGSSVSGPFIPASTSVVSVKGGSVTLSANATGTLAHYTFSFQPVTVVLKTANTSKKPVVSIAWWGALAAMDKDSDAAPAIRSAGGSNRTIYFPPTGRKYYTVKSLTASPYPPVTGIGATIGIDWYGFDNFKVEAHGATLTADARHNNSVLLAIRYGSTFDLGGLHFAATTSLPCCEPSALMLINVAHFHVHDLWWDGNWGGSTKQPAAMAINWAKDGTFHALHLPKAALCADTAFLKNTRWTAIRARGADDNADGGAARTNCINVERDSNFLGYYPQIADDAGYADSRGNTFGPGLNIANFASAIFLRAGSGYRITGNRLFGNPGAAAYGGGAAGHTLGAGIYLLYDTQPGVQTFTDPVTDVLIDHNTIARNGAPGSSRAGECGSSRGPGAGVVIDASCVFSATVTVAKTSAATPFGRKLLFSPLRLPGWIAMKKVRIRVIDATTPFAIRKGTTVRTENLFSGEVTLSKNVADGGVRAGDTIDFAARQHRASRGVISDVSVQSNMFDSNNTAGVELFKLSVLKGVHLGANNTYRGPKQRPWMIATH